MEGPPLGGKIARGGQQDLHNRRGNTLDLAAVDGDLIACRPDLDQILLEGRSSADIENVRQHVGTRLIVRIVTQFSHPPEIEI